MTAQRIAWITGASTGIGAAVAQHMAREGYTVAVSARSVDKLQALAGQHYGSGRIFAYPLDVTRSDDVAATVKQIVMDLGTIDCAILCAGTYFPSANGSFDAEAVKKQFDLNVMGVAYGIDAVFPLMQFKPDKQIAIVASVAGYRGLPQATGYGATKAALINMAEGLKFDCDTVGIKLQLICPGFVKTPLTDKNKFKMPFLISADEAARIIVKGLASSKFEIVFPWPMFFIMKLLRWLPYALFFPLVKAGTGAGRFGVIAKPVSGN